MSEPFSLSRSRCADGNTSLREELLVRTGSELAASGILRSIQRFGVDPTIVRYEVSPKPHNRLRKPAAVAWTVRAVRAGGGPGA